MQVIAWMITCICSSKLFISTLLVLLAFPIRLADGNALYSGRVEIYRNGAWGTVCNDNWTNTNGRVICEQLFGFASSPLINSNISAGAGPILMDNVNCSNIDNNLLACSHRGFGNHNCGHSEDIGIICFLRPTSKQFNQ